MIATGALGASGSSGALGSTRALKSGSSTGRADLGAGRGAGRCATARAGRLATSGSDRPAALAAASSSSIAANSALLPTVVAGVDDPAASAASARSISSASGSAPFDDCVSSTVKCTPTRRRAKKPPTPPMRPSSTVTTRTRPSYSALSSASRASRSSPSRYSVEDVIDNSNRVDGDRAGREFGEGENGQARDGHRDQATQRPADLRGTDEHRLVPGSGGRAVPVGDHGDDGLGHAGREQQYGAAFRGAEGFEHRLLQPGVDGEDVQVPVDRVLRGDAGREGGAGGVDEPVD